MARVEIKVPRIQSSNFGLYRTSAGGDESIVVRRKVGEPTDYMHLNSRKLIEQRHNFALASQHYAHLSPSQKAITRHQFEEVEYLTSHGKTETKLLTGRQLFIAKDIHELNVYQKQIKLPLEICIVLTDSELNPIDGEIWLYYMVAGEWFDLHKDKIGPGNWLFSTVPPGCPAYRVYGEALTYIDPQLPEHQSMTEKELKAHHYHKLISETADYYFKSSTWYNNQGFHQRTPFDCSVYRVKTLIHFGNLAGLVRTQLRSDGYPYVILATDDYEISSVDGQWTEHLTTWSGLDLKKDVYYPYYIYRPGPRLHRWIYELWWWFIP